VNPATVERVNAAAVSLGYQPDYLARSFKTKRTFSIGVVIPDINNPLFPPMVRGLEDGLAGAGYLALLANTENDEERERRTFELLKNRRVDGFALATARMESPNLVELARERVPIVLFNRVVAHYAFSSVSVDDGAGIRLAVGHLSELGHHRIAHIAGPRSLSTGLGRYQGYITGMRMYAKAAGRRLVSFATSFSIAEGERCAKQLLALRERPTAIVAANDMLALGCYSAAEEAGLRCPDDISIVGFNDMPFIDRLSPPLTTVRIPQYEMGLRAAELMLERIDVPDAPIKVLLLPPTLVVRGSTGPVEAKPRSRTANGLNAKTSRPGASAPRVHRA
jgi:LacI family transcriptional regulator